MIYYELLCQELNSGILFDKIARLEYSPYIIRDMKFYEAYCQELSAEILRINTFNEHRPKWTQPERLSMMTVKLHVCERFPARLGKLLTPSAQRISLRTLETAIARMQEHI